MSLFRVHPEPQADVMSVAFSPNGQWLASASRDTTINIWDQKSGELWRTNNVDSSYTTTPLRTLRGHSGDTRSVAFSPNGQWLASGSRDKTVKIWDPNTGKLLRTLQGHKDTVSSVAFSPYEQLLASGSRDDTIKIWVLDKILE